MQDKINICMYLIFRSGEECSNSFCVTAVDIPFTQLLLFESHTSYYFQLLYRFVWKHPVRILLPSSNQHDQEVFELQEDQRTVILQPVINRYLIYGMPQDRINIRIDLICKIWRRMFQ